VSPTDAKTSNPVAYADAVIPPLSKWSDIMGIQWIQDPGFGTSTAPLSYIIRSGITNVNTKAMIQQAFVTMGQGTVPGWPGYSFTPADATTTPPDISNTQTKAFLGLLGTYHGAAGGYLLAQHRELYGMQYISKIQVWAYDAAPWSVSEGSYNNLYASMIIYVTNVPS
jgi:hypothetical protein